MRILIILFLSINSLAAQSGFTPEKVDSNLWKKVFAGGSEEFIVVLQEQADVRGAAQFRNKTDKGRYVYETLLELAERTQPPVRAALRAAGAPVNSLWIVNAVGSYGNAGLILRLADMPEVARVEDNPIVHLQRPVAENDRGVDERVMTPVSWGLTKINADDVWNLGYTGTGIVVGGQDTGYEWEHPALKNKYRGWNGSSADHNYNWHDAIHDTINAGASNSCGLNLMAPCDDDNHGTHTMGTMVGGEGDNIYGVAPDAQWIGCRNMEEGDGRPFTYIECFQWFVAPTNLAGSNADPGMAPHVINNSWGCPPSELCNSSNFATMDAVINSVKAAGIVVVTSAGNDGPTCSTVNNPPSIFSASFAVGATNSSDGIANFSSRGPVTVYNNGLKKPNISAPGMTITSSVGHDNNASTYGYGSSGWSGTSMAGPHVAGTVALILSARPDLIGQVDVVQGLITSTALPRFASAPFCGTDNGSSRPNNVYGWGRVDALAAVNAAVALPVELVSFSAEARGQAALLRWTTATETNCARFEIERSTDVISWKPLGSVACSAHSVSLKQYDYTDAAPAPGLNYYRLRQIDLSGDFTYSPVASVRFGTAGVKLRVIPHPGQQNLFLEVLGGASGEHWRVSMLSIDGRLVQSADLDLLLTLQAPGLAHGVYAVLLQDERGKVVDVEKVMW